jgi:hypothetical protein
VKYLLLIILFIASCKSGVEMPAKFCGVWSKEGQENILIDITRKENRYVVTQFYADHSGPNTPNGLYYDKKKDQLSEPGAMHLSISLKTENGKEILVVSLPPGIERYRRNDSIQVPWRR